MGSPIASEVIEDYLIDGAGVGGFDEDWRCVLQSFGEDATAGDGCGFRMRIGEEYGDVSALEPSSSKKRSRNVPCVGPKSKACREKMRRDRLNDRFKELSSVLDPGLPPKADKTTLLSDAARMLTQLRAEARELKESNEKLRETIKDLKVEKNELRDEKMKLKADKDRLEQQIKTMSITPGGFMPHPLAFHPAAAPATFAPCLQAPPANKATSYPAYPGMAMWQWLPPAVVDTSHDTQLWPPNA